MCCHSRISIRTPVILHTRQGENPLWPHIRISIDTAGMSPNGSSMRLAALLECLCYRHDLPSGDVPAVSMLMRMCGHNGFSPCRVCKITGVRIPNSRVTTHYVPLIALDILMFAIKDRDCNLQSMALPLRTEDEILRQANEVNNDQIST